MTTDVVPDTAATTAGLSFSLPVFGEIDATPEAGSFNTLIDHDWYAVTLTAGHTYSFLAQSAGTLTDFAMALRDANRNTVDRQGVVDANFPNFTYTPRVTGTYYLDISAGGSNPQGQTGGYDIITSDLGLQPPDTVLDTPATTASLTMNGQVTGTIDALPASGSFNNVVDHDWYAVNLTAGERYTFTASGTGLSDVAISLMNANRTVVDTQGVVDGGSTGSTITFTAPTSGTYYLSIGAGGSNAANAIGGYQITTTDNGPNHLVINLVADTSVTQEFGANYQTSAFWTGVEAAANFFETTFFDPITVTIDVGWGEALGNAVATGAQSRTFRTNFSFSQIVAALTQDAQSADDATALAHLPTQDPGLGGADFKISDAEARALGLSTTAPPVDGGIGVATNWDPTNPSFVSVVEHEISEVLGRTSGINASTGLFSGQYSVLDLFRYAAGPPITAEPSSATGPGGVGSTYFSIDGGATALETFSSTAGADPGGDWAVNSGIDAFGGIPLVASAPVSAADLTEMDVLGYDRQPRPLPLTAGGGIDYRVPANGGTPTSYIGAAAIAAAGYQFAIEYIGTAGNAGFLRAGDSSALVQQGLSIVSVYAKTGMSDTNPDGSYNNAWVSYFNNNGALGQGTADAIDAINAAKAAGQASGAIYFDVNLNPADARSGITQSAALAEIDEYFREINAYFTQAGVPYSIGVFGAGATLSFLQADASAGVKYTWLADTWLNEIGAVTSKNLEQTDTSGGAMVGGQPVDLDTAYTTDFGQWKTTAIESHGSTSLVGVGQNYFLDSAGGSPGPELKYGGSPVVAGQFGDIYPIAAEQTPTGYEVAWQQTGADAYWVWNTDSNGNDRPPHPFNGVSGSTPGLEALEPSFGQDLNGDGVIGIPPNPSSTLIQVDGSTYLTQVGNEYFLDNSSGVGPALSYGGSPVTAGQFGSGLAPVGAVQTATGYEVAWEQTGANQFWVWTTDNNGNDTPPHVFNNMPGNSFAVEAIETAFNQDLNGDHTIGPPGMTVIETNGSTWLTQVGNNYYLYNSSGVGPELRYQGTPVVAGQFGAGIVPIAAEQTATGYEVAWKQTGADAYWVWNTDNNGNDLPPHPFNGVSGSTAGLEALEASFRQDLNGDGVIGVPAGAGASQAFGTSQMLLLPDQDMTSGAFSFVSAGSASMPASSQVLATGDFLGNGNPDLLWLGSNNTPEISEVIGGSAADTIALPATPSSWRLVGGDKEAYFAAPSSAIGADGLQNPPSIGTGLVART